MNRKFMMALALWAVSMTSTAFADNTFKTWIGAEENTSLIETGLTDGRISNGLWFYTFSVNYLNEVQIDWYPAYVPPEPSAHKLDGVVRNCGGICGTAIFDTTKSTSYISPSVVIAFYVLKDTTVSFGSSPPAEGDASAWGGLCVTYTSDLDIKLELDNTLTQHSLNQSGFRASSDTICYAKPTAILPASTTGNMMRVAWSAFEQPYTFNCNSKLSGEEIAKRLQLVTFRIHGETGSYKFNICAVGPYDGTCPETCEPPGTTGFKNVHKSAETLKATEVKAILNGRTLGFTGIKSTATAEVMNSLGQVVARGVIEGTASTLNLAHLDAGIYLVQVVGMSTNFTNKIVLK